VSFARTLEVDIRVVEPRSRRVLAEVAFSAEPGITILFGPSGAGKSTTLSAIAGLLRPESGRIRLGDEVWFDASKRIDRAIETRKVAFVFQSIALFPHMNALHNVQYGIDRAIDKRERRQRAMAMLEKMKVAHLAHRRPATFSGGEGQRVALARAFAMSPSIVLLDEALSAMDRDLRMDLAQDLRRFVDENPIPILQVTHHRNEARAMGDRAVLIDHGRIQNIGPVRQLIPDLAKTGASTRAELFDEIDTTPLPDLKEVKR
jgi:molybdate transport system ATP-binding protein